MLPIKHTWDNGLYVRGFPGNMLSENSYKEQVGMKQAWNAGKTIQSYVIQLATTVDKW